MNKNIITVTGYSCSGKSTLINKIKEKYVDCDIISFGLIHKECVREHGYAYGKEWIALEGFEAYENALIRFFKKNLMPLIEKKDNLLIIDGMFSDKCFSVLRDSKGIELTNIVLNTDYNIRAKRMMERQCLDYDEAVRHMTVTDNIKENAGLCNIVKDFDYMIDGNLSKEQIKEKCVFVLEKIEERIKERHIDEVVTSLNTQDTRIFDLNTDER